MNAPIVPRHASDFAEMYAEHFPFVWRVLRRLGVEPDALDDRAQDVFLVAHRRWSEFERRSADRTWLYGIARRVAADHRRGRVRRVRRRHALAQAQAVQGPGRRDSTEALVFLDTFMDGLEAEVREAFVLFELEGLSGKEAAELTGVNANTLYARRRKARQLFEARLGSDQVETRHLRRVARAHEADAEAERRVANLLPFMGVAYFELAAAEGASLPATTGATQAGWMSWSTLKFVLGGALVGATALALAPAPKAAPVDTPKPVPALASSPTPAPSPVPSAAPPAPTPVTQPADSEPVEAPTPPKTRSPAMPVDAGPPAATGDLGEQTQRHQASREALRAGRFAEALQSASAYLERWPDGPFADASRILRIEALCASGKERQARGEAGRLRLNGADTKTLATLRRTCVGDSLP